MEAEWALSITSVAVVFSDSSKKKHIVLTLREQSPFKSLQCNLKVYISLSDQEMLT